MTKIDAQQFRIRSNQDGTTRLTFYGSGGKEVDVKIRNAAMMGLALELRKAANFAPIPISRRATSGGRRSLSGPNTVPPFEDTGARASEGTMFGVSVSADLQFVSAWFNFNVKEGVPGTRVDIDLQTADTERLIADLTKALALVKTRPQASAPTKH